MKSRERPPITDSPWFWVYLFGTGALIALMLIDQQYGPRQARLERQFQARERAGQVAVRDESDRSLSEPDDTLISLKPLYAVLALVAVTGWALLWWRHFHGRGGNDSASKAPGSGTSSSLAADPGHGADP